MPIRGELMPPFRIWPSEALLLGYSVGSYSGGSLFRKFLSHLKETVSHFTADFGFLGHAGCTPIVRDDGGASVRDLQKRGKLDELFVFMDVGGDYRVGVSPEIPDVLVEKPQSYNSVRAELWEQYHVGPHPLSTRLAEGRRSLTDLVIIHFGEFLDLSPGQHLLRHLAMIGQSPEGWSGVVRRFFTQPDAAAAWQSLLAAGDERMDKCSEKLQQLADENGWGEAYRAGRLFGEACRQTTTEELRYWLWNDAAADELKCEIAEPLQNGEDVFYSGPNAQLDQLLQLGVVNSSLLCASVLSSMRSRSLELTIEETRDWLADELLDILIVRDTRRMLRELSWCFGALYGELWRGDASFRNKPL